MKRAAFLTISFLIIVFDLVTKQWILDNFEIHEGRTVVPGFFDITHVRNTGAAFGLGANSSSSVIPLLLHGGALIVFLVVLVYAFRSAVEEKLLQTGLHLIIGGAVGNLIDRFRFGSVVDFLDVYVTIGGKERHWPAFNVADSAICVGIALLFIDTLRRPAESDQPARSPRRA